MFTWCFLTDVSLFCRLPKSCFQSFYFPKERRKFRYHKTKEIFLMPCFLIFIKPFLLNCHSMKVIHQISLTRMVLIHLSMRISLASTEKKSVRRCRTRGLLLDDHQQRDLREPWHLLMPTTCPSPEGEPLQPFCQPKTGRTLILQFSSWYP